MGRVKNSLLNPPKPRNYFFFFSKMKLSLSSLCKQNPVHFQRSIINRFYGTTSTKQKPDWVYARIAPLGSPDLSMVPLLEQWVKEGKPVGKTELLWITNRLNSYKRYKHALEVPSFFFFCWCSEFWDNALRKKLFVFLIFNDNNPNGSHKPKAVLISRFSKYETNN